MAKPTRLQQRPQDGAGEIGGPEPQCVQVNLQSEAPAGNEEDCPDPVLASAQLKATGKGRSLRSAGLAVPQASQRAVC